MVDPALPRRAGLAARLGRLTAAPRVGAWQAYLAAGVAATGIYFALGTQGKAVLYVAIGVSSVFAVLAGTVRNLRAGERAPWFLFAVGLLAQAGGDAVFNYYDAFAGRESPFPSVADALYLGGYPVLVAGMLLLVRRLGSFRGGVAFADAAIVMVGFALVQWVFFIQPLTSGEYSWLDQAILIAYPAMDLLLAAALVAFIGTSARRNPALSALIGSVILLLAADEIYGLTPDSYAFGSWLDSFWLLSYVLWGTAALHPAVARIRGEEIEPGLGPARAALLAAGILSAPVVLAVQEARGRDVQLAIAIGGAVLSMLVLARFIDLVRRVNRQNERLRELDRAKDEFVSLVSHELRTPLTSIGGYTELLADEDVGPLNESQQQFIAIIRRNSDRLLRVVGDLLFAARLRSGRLEIERGEVDVLDVAQDAVEEARPTAEAADLSLELEAEEVPVISGDRARISQLLGNLISNAIKFSRAGGRVVVRVRAEDTGVRLEVEDSGIGIPANELDDLFTRFFRSSTALERQIPGTGLGLYAVKAIADAHDGSVDVRSEPGVGTCFSVRLPAG